MDCDHLEISIVIADDPFLQELNSRYRGIDRATNVLSFPMLEGEDAVNIPGGLLGDVVISLDTAQREADDADITLSERVSQLLVHGILHLIGFDHERNESAAEHMENKSLEILHIIEPEKKLDAM